MANAFATNYTISGAANCFSLVWKLTRTMKKAGWIVTASSDGYIRDVTGTPGTSQTASTAATTDRWGNNADPNNDTYPINNLSDAGACWIVLSGPKTVKIPLNAAPTGIFVRGETVTQATSSAEGELLGYVWDIAGLTGYAVILPHTGTFDNSHTITGSTSSATFVPTGTVVVYGREIMISKASGINTNNPYAGTQGLIYYVCADVVAEAAQFFSAVANGTTLASTTIAVASNAAVLPQATINVASTVGFYTASSGPAIPGTILVTTSNGPQIVSYTGVGSATTFTGCSGGTGTMSTGGAITAGPVVAPGSLGTQITAGSNSAALPQATINVLNTGGFPASGTFNISISANNWQTITYTGLTTTTFTGCSGGTGTMLTNQIVSKDFPTKAICVRGGIYNTGTSGMATQAPWISNNLNGYVATNNGQAACVNATPSAGVSADGSFYVIATTNNGYTNNPLTNTVSGIMYTIVDDSEPGDVDPYVFMVNMGQSFTTWNNTLSNGNPSSQYWFYVPQSINTTTGNVPSFMGYAARGCPVASRDVPSIWTGTVYTAFNTYLISTGITAPMRVTNCASALSAATTTIKEHILLWNNTVTGIGALNQIKGKTRWAAATALGSVYDTYDNKTWINVAYATQGSSGPTIIFGPYDGSTTPKL
jgi:hypothetical protein